MALTKVDEVKAATTTRMAPAAEAEAKTATITRAATVVEAEAEATTTGMGAKATNKEVEAKAGDAKAQGMDTPSLEVGARDPMILAHSMSSQPRYSGAKEV